MKRLIVICVAAASMAACSGGGGSTATTGPPATTAVADTAAITTPTSSTTSPSSTTTSPPATTTTLAPTTTTVATEDLIKQAVQDYFAAYEACGADPASCLPDNFTAAQGRSRQTVADLVSGMVKQGLRFSADLNGSYVVVESVAVNSPTEVAAVTCWFDAGAVLGPLGPDGNPTVVDNQVVSYRYKFVLYLQDGSWRVGEQLDLEHLGEGNLCAATS